MSSPSQQATELMTSLEGLLKQAANDPDSVKIDIGEARKLKQSLDNVIAAADQEQAEGKDKKKSKSGNGDDEEEKDDEKDSSQKKSGY